MSTQQIETHGPSLNSLHWAGGIRRVWLLLGILPIVIALPTSGIGMRHDVPAQLYLDLAANREPFVVGHAPDFSTVAAIVRLGGKEQFEVIGSGVLIHPEWILTAAHVVMAPPDSGMDFLPDLQVRFGLSARSPNEERRIINILTPIPLRQLRPLFGRGRGFVFSDRAVYRSEFHDLALIHLDHPVTSMPPAAIDDTQVELLNQLICLSGFGEAASGNVLQRKRWKDDFRKRAAENVIDRVILENTHLEAPGGILLFDFDNGDTQRNTLQGDASAWSPLFGTGESSPSPMRLEGAAYPGDSGGPAFAHVDGQWRVVGISGYGTGFPKLNSRSTIQYGDILVFTHVRSHATWIRTVLESSARAALEESHAPETTIETAPVSEAQAIPTEPLAESQSDLEADQSQGFTLRSLFRKKP